MKEITLTALTPIGEKALEQNQKESMKLKLKEKMMFKLMGYTQEYMTDPKRAILRITNQRYSASDFLKIIKKEIIESLKKNGAKINIDYTMEIK